MHKEKKEAAIQAGGDGGEGKGGGNGG